MRSGVVYYIRSKTNGRVYIGSTMRSPNQRRLEHMHFLRKGEHHCKQLQRTYNKYGEDDLEFSVVEHVEDANFLLGREQFHIWRHERNAMNSAPVSDSIYAAHAVNRGRIQGPEERAMRSAAQKGKHSGRVWTEEARKAHSEALKGRKMPPATPERCANISKALKGRKRSAQAIAAAIEGKAKIIKAEVPTWLAMLAEGKSYRQIEKETGRSRSVIARECKEAMKQ